MHRWDQLLEEYMEVCGIRGLSASHMSNIRRELERLGVCLKRCRSRRRLEDVGMEELASWLTTRTKFHAKATLRGLQSILRGWGEFLVHRGVWSSNPLRWMLKPKVPLRVPGRIGRGAMDRLVKGASESFQSYSGSLWLAVFGLLYGTGLRRGELSRLNLEDFIPAERVLRIDGRKTGRQRAVMLPEVTCRCLESYLPHRANQLVRAGCIEPQAALLVSQRGTRLSCDALSSGMKRIARRVGLGRVTLQQFRHTCASDLLEEGVSLPEVQRQLGHQTIRTTARYLHIADPQRRAAVDLHPINGILGGERKGVQV